MSDFKREIFMSNGQYLMCDCEVIGEWYRCFHETKGYFLARHGMGTVCEVDIHGLEVTRLLQQAENAAHLKSRIEALEGAVVILEEGSEPQKGDVVKLCDKSKYGKRGRKALIVQIEKFLQNEPYYCGTGFSSHLIERIIMRNNKPVIYNPSASEKEGG